MSVMVQVAVGDVSGNAGVALLLLLRARWACVRACRTGSSTVRCCLSESDRNLSGGNYELLSHVPVLFDLAAVRGLSLRLLVSHLLYTYLICV